MRGSVSHERIAGRTEIHNLCPKKSCFLQWTFSGRPGSMLDSFSSCSIAKQHGRANTGKQGSRESGSTRKISRSNVLTVFLCLISYTLSLSLSNHCRRRWHLPRNRNSGQTDWCVENSGFKNKGPQSWQRSPLDAYGFLQTTRQRWTLQLPLEEEVEPTYQRTRAVQHLGRIFAYFFKCHSCAFTQRGAKLCFGLEMNKIFSSNSIIGLQSPQTLLLIASHTGNPMCWTKRYGKKEVVHLINKSAGWSVLGAALTWTYMQTYS